MTSGIEKGTNRGNFVFQLGGWVDGRFFKPWTNNEWHDQHMYNYDGGDVSDNRFDCVSMRTDGYTE